MTRAREVAAPKVALATEDERTAAEVVRVAAMRGYPVERLGLEAAIHAPVGVIVHAPGKPITPEVALRLAPLCQSAAENRRPVILCATMERVRGKQAEERAAALSYLRAHGAIPCDDPDAWFEAAALVAGFGVPRGPKVAIIAPPGGWLYLQATSLSIEDEARGANRLPVAEMPGDAPPADVALVDMDAIPPSAPDRVGRALVVPIVARAEMLSPSGPPALVGLRAALTAVALVGRHAERLQQGLGPGLIADVKKLKVDRARMEKALDQPGERLGDHESKLLLSAFGVPVTRQGVAATPSAAVRIAQSCGFPVEVKIWDPKGVTEYEGGPVIVGLRNPPDVRRGFAQAASAAGMPIGALVIVRVTPPPGRNVAARIEKIAELGWTVLLEVPGHPKPLAAPAPLRRADADELASAVESSRAGEAAPDLRALADLLLRASLCAVDQQETVDAIDMGRIVVASKGNGAVVVDARTRLKRRKR
ncbi:MAG: acetate--CoA ligase family protein [Deltaproteobacteria bacterium]|nr:acetate--CoA ligase family protein [Deltaproteobacteria bacterium]